jgi:hypothetical protein
MTTTTPAATAAKTKITSALKAIPKIWQQKTTA